ncbi:ribose ABC transporter permease [Spirochaetia bacterium]|nr:ribose ABC transporter permease [Spirochaetia bacterium]
MDNGAIKRNRSDIFLEFFLNNKALIILLVLCIGCAIASPNFLSGINLRNVLRQICTSAMIGVGFTCVIASGNLDLSVGYMLGMLGVMMGLLSKTSLPFPAVILIGLLIGAACGFFNGIIGVRFRLPLFIVTLATGQVFKGICYLISNTSPITGLPPAFKFIGQGYIGPVPIPVYIVAAATVIIYVILNRTAFGRYAIATGGNRDAARTSGINTNSVTVWIYVLMGLCTAVAAIIMTGRAASAQPAAGQGMEMDAIAAVVIGGTPLIGGKGKVMGTVFGCLIVGVINNALNLSRVDSNWQLIAKGALILIAVLLDVITETYFQQKLKKA